MPGDPQSDRISFVYPQRSDRDLIKCTTHNEGAVCLSPEQVIPDIAFGRAVELSSRTALGHKRTCVSGYYSKRKRKIHALDKRSGFYSELQVWGTTNGGGTSAIRK